MVKPEVTLAVVKQFPSISDDDFELWSYASSGIAYFLQNASDCRVQSSAYGKSGTVSVTRKLSTHKENLHLVDVLL